MKRLHSRQDTLLTALRLQQRAASVGFDWPDAQGPRAKVEEELKELDRETRKRKRATIEDEIGDLLFAVVNLARKLGIDPRTALHSANSKFERRFAAVVQLAEQRGLQLGKASLEQLDQLWEEVKASRRR